MIRPANGAAQPPITVFPFLWYAVRGIWPAWAVGHYKKQPPSGALPWRPAVSSPATDCHNPQPKPVAADGTLASWTACYTLCHTGRCAFTGSDSIMGGLPWRRFPTATTSPGRPAAVELKKEALSTPLQGVPGIMARCGTWHWLALQYPVAGTMDAMGTMVDVADADSYRHCHFSFYSSRRVTKAAFDRVALHPTSWMLLILRYG